MTRSKKILLLVQVFLAGAMILVIEFVGQRWLDNTWGSSTDAWGATLAAVLGLMSLGYLLGGMVADRWPGRRLLPVVFSLSALLLLMLSFFLPDLMPSLREAVPSSRYGPLLAAFLLLGPPVALLATVSPIVIRLLQEDPEHAGRIAGRVYAIGTLGSILGALLVPYVLLGNFPLPTLLACSAAFLAILALPSARPWQLLPLLLILLLAPLSAIQEEKYSFGNGKQLALQSSQYQTIAVSSQSGIRVLHFLSGPDAWQSAWDPRDPDLIQLAYVRAMQRWHCQVPDPRRVALIGVGAGSAIRAIRQISPGSQIDGVELDREVLRVSRHWMGLPPSGNGIAYHVSDGRAWLRQEGEGEFDVILLDAFAGKRVPAHFLTREFFAEARSRLTSRGVLGMNVIADESDQEWLGSVLATARSVFPEVQIYEVGSEKNNVILWAGGSLAQIRERRCLERLEEQLRAVPAELVGAKARPVIEGQPWSDTNPPKP